MGATRSTVCRVCGAPREEGKADALCLEHRRERDRMERRRQRGVPMDLPAPKPREFPRGSCRQCGGVVEKQGLCREHRLEYQRAWAEAERRRKGMAVKGKYRPRVEPGACRICGKPRHTREYSRAALCEEHLREESRLKMQEKREKKRNAGKWRGPSAAKDVPCFVGPEYVPTVRPVNVEAYDLVRVRVPFEVMEEEQREREWAEWFAARGL